MYVGLDAVSFEPPGKAHRQLIEDARSDPRWTVAPRMVLLTDPASGSKLQIDGLYFWKNGGGLSV